MARGGRPAAQLPRVLEGEVVELASGGDGVIHTEHGDVFCAGVFPGERVRLSGLRRRGKHIVAQASQVLQPSPDRVDAPCEHAAACGGCAWMSLAPSAQRAARRQLIERALNNARLTPEHPVELDETGVERTLGYRSRARMHFDKGVLGYRAAGSRALVAIDRCVVQAPAIASAAAALGDVLRASSPGGAGVCMDVHLGTGAHGVVAELRSDDTLPPELYGMLEALVAAETLEGVGVLAGGATCHAIFGDPSEVSPGVSEGARTSGGSGAAPGDASLRVPLGGFSQANPWVNAALVATVVDWIEASGQATLELYSGSGNLSVALAAAGAELTSVEREADATALAIANLAARGLSAKAHHRDASESPRQRFTRVVLDPPREGAADAVERILTVHRPERVVYVSCDPRTLARDLANLVAGGYRLERVRGFDMFPHTPHVETVALLVRLAPA